MRTFFLETWKDWMSVDTHATFAFHVSQCLNVYSCTFVIYMLPFRASLVRIMSLSLIIASVSTLGVWTVSVIPLQGTNLVHPPPYSGTEFYETKMYSMMHLGIVYGNEEAWQVVSVF